MSKTKFIATDTIYGAEGLLTAGDSFELSGEVAVKKAQKRGHLLADSKEAKIFLEKLKKKKSFASRLTKDVAPAKEEFNDDEENDGRKPIDKMNLVELQEVAEGLEIDIENDKGKPLTKKELIKAIEEKEAEEKEADSDLA